jgi:leader peptidase (prepilin peptidase)/N-methyltransferase
VRLALEIRKIALVSGPAVVVGAALLTGLTTALVVRPVLRRLPEPQDRGSKPPYQDLGTGRFVALCGSGSALAGGLGGLALPPALQPVWSVLATVGVILAMIDARTTWLPAALTRVGWVLMPAAFGVGVLLGGTVGLVVRGAIGALVGGALYLAVWALTRGGFGFGDVRFAPLIGAATAAHSWTLLWSGLTLGTVVGGLYGAVRLASRRREPFAYGPSMLIGAYAALGVSALT